MKKLFIYSMVFAMAISCKPKDVQPDVELWSSCGDKYDQATTLSKLVGQWRLVATGCGFCVNPGVRKTDLNVKIDISANRKITTFQNDTVTAVSDFKLVNSYNEGFFTLETIPSYQNQYTWGVIEFCENRVVFKNSYVDGGDFYFERIK